MQIIFLIRHAEKPVENGDSGVDQAGAADPRSLTPRGWQRAGMWAELFAPSLAAAPLPRLTAIFASAPADRREHGDGSKSRRPLETVAALAAKVGIPVNLDFSKGREAEAARAIANAGGVALVCWQHEAILDIATALDPTPPGLPGSWPGERFNVVLRLSRADPGSPWEFQQIAPRMLDDDITSPI